MSTYIERLGAAAQEAAKELNGLTAEQKNECLFTAAKFLTDGRQEILAANEDCLLYTSFRTVHGAAS